MKNFKIEICTNAVASCVEAQKGGAYRVELCASIPEGGTTPSYGEIMVARQLLEIKLHVIIRPRGGDFLYSTIEHDTMLKDIEMCKNIGVDGIVIGSLTADGEVNIPRNRELIEAAGTMSVTFHRAFDMCCDPFESMERIISLGCERILTSGQQPKAEQGIDLIAQLVKKAENRVIIMPGSGINEHNIARIAQETNASEFHFSARLPLESKMRYRNPSVSMGGINITINEYQQQVTNTQKVKNTIQQLKLKLSKL